MQAVSSALYRQIVLFGGSPDISTLPASYLAPLIIARLRNIAARFDLPVKAVAASLGISCTRVIAWTIGKGAPRNDTLVFVTMVDRITSIYPSREILECIGSDFNQFLVTTERKRQYPGKVQTKRRLAARAKRAAEAAKAAMGKPQ